MHGANPPDVRTMLVLYTAFIVVGLVLYSIIGLTHH